MFRAAYGGFPGQSHLASNMAAFNTAHALAAMQEESPQENQPVTGATRQAGGHAWVARRASLPPPCPPSSPALPRHTTALDMMPTPVPLTPGCLHRTTAHTAARPVHQPGGASDPKTSSVVSPPALRSRVSPSKRGPCVTNTDNPRCLANNPAEE
ncbi:hypothetical protein E2C01_088257 [Portunus trituberculatus]|uniref:Uncharacterized protein n=1 Tax=Portunus trituberculatus TaxID=210409 RepID=A0A5B7JLF5_PORTR|nr:hypothetical protein [Portunus trituberculatus]